MKRWQDWVNAVLGVALIVSPWILGFGEARSAAAWSAWILGGAVLIVALASQLIPAAWGEALMLLFGLCSIASPWVLGYSAESRPVSSAVIIGALVAVLSLWATFTDAAVRNWMQAHRQRRSPAQ
jgi:SPW repeat